MTERTDAFEQQRQCRNGSERQREKLKRNIQRTLSESTGSRRLQKGRRGRRKTKAPFPKEELKLQGSTFCVVSMGGIAQQTWHDVVIVMVENRRARRHAAMMEHNA